MSNMLPDKNMITIHDNKKLINNFIKDMIITPRQLSHKWSKITNQTPNLKLGYPAQHLASLIVGMRGAATGARGNDIIDKSEVKACSKVDQSDKCRNCNKSILRIDKKCPYCGSSNIKRNNDSKWLISIKSIDELNMILNETPRFIFIVTDYPQFDTDNFDDIRIRAFEVWVQSIRCKNFRELLTSYYYNIYLKHIEQNPSLTPAPKNLFPDNFPFFMCNPIKTFECTIYNADKEFPDIDISYYVSPEKDRCLLKSEDMPITLLNEKEKNYLYQKILISIQ